MSLEILALFPDSSVEAGDIEVAVVGDEFTGVTDVTFDGVSATDLVFVSDGMLTVTAPAGAGVVDVVVTTPLGTSSPFSFTYVAPPTTNVINKSNQGAFNEAAFRDGILFAMNMGTPKEVEERVTFVWEAKKDYLAEDGKGVPFKLDDAGTLVTPERTAQIPLALEFINRSTLSGGTGLEAFDTPRVVLTVMDTEFPQIQGADYMIIDGDHYDIKFEAPPVGLFNVTVHTIHGHARDET